MQSPVEVPDICKILHALHSLHKIGVAHGDPRLPNLVWIDGRLLWIDLACAKFESTPGLRLQDWRLLISSILEFKSIPQDTIVSLIDRVLRGDGSSNSVDDVSSNEKNLDVLAAEIHALLSGANTA